MEILGGLSDELKIKISKTNVAIIGQMAVDLIRTTVSRMGFTEITIHDMDAMLPSCDVAICTYTQKEEYKNLLRHYRSIGVPVICTFNFGVGACVTICNTDSPLPLFIEDRYGDNVVSTMLEYTKGYSKFWVIPRNEWLEYVPKWMEAPELGLSIGENTIAAMAAHILIALVAANKVKIYPKFYLSTIANDVN